MPNQPIRCVLADDHPAVLTAVSDFLEEHNFTVVARCANGYSALESVRREQPAIAILDNRMPGKSGIELIEEILAVSAKTRVIIYTGEGTTEIAREVLAAGAHAILLKGAPLEDLLRALHAAAAGTPYVDPALVELPNVRATKIVITRREREVLQLLAEGHGQREIGTRLSIGTETVRAHLQKARKRLSAATTTQAVAEAMRLGLLG
jgi:DNA-binding NarL/FixJ family response regulator